METAEIHTVKPLKVDILKGWLMVVTGVSGSGKTTWLHLLKNYGSCSAADWTASQ